jgi:hypothetical protein
MRLLLSFALLLSALFPVCAQEFSGGFRAGLNFITFDGDVEKSPDGETTYESLTNTTGFHVGATFALAFTDLVGIKAELMYSQKGVERRFAENTPSYFYLYANEEDRVGVPFGGVLEAQIDVVNSYIDIPLTAYYRIGIVELEAGGSMGFLVNSRATGGYTFNNTVFGADPVVFNVEGSYFRDEAGGGGVTVRDTEVRGNPGVLLPQVVSVYYNNDNDAAVYRRLDFAAIVGVSVFLNSGLFVGLRYQHGLTDLTKGENDLRVSREDLLSDREYNTDDKDYTRNLQASVGFRF